MAPLTWSLGAARPCGHPDGIGSGNGGLNVVAEKIGGKVLKATNILAEAFAVAKDLHVDAKQHTVRPRSPHISLGFPSVLGTGGWAVASRQDGRREEAAPLSIFHCSLFLLDGGALGADD
ncbi:hypothetical protein VPH35_115519 [Triticum aestivum]|uniref:Uncharacterized protein n=1 Tax=Aegilops tauschii TaxID=37682 RepID=M8C2T1_AEGTA